MRPAPCVGAMERPAEAIVARAAARRRLAIPFKGISGAALARARRRMSSSSMEKAALIAMPTRGNCSPWIMPRFGRMRLLYLLSHLS